ncbi:hypothetical protein LZ32DRAFT_60453 [Colletotrichum eremochloae]|nr:hypothetical protein LZ32DRAFT_60453 [Colletotrichum eremochloae]
MAMRVCCRVQHAPPPISALWSGPIRATPSRDGHGYGLTRNSRHLSVCLSVWPHGKMAFRQENVVCACTTSPSPNGTLLVGGRYALRMRHLQNPTGPQPCACLSFRKRKGTKERQKKSKYGMQVANPSSCLPRVCNDMQCHASAPPVREMECSRRRESNGGRQGGCHGMQRVGEEDTCAAPVTFAVWAPRKEGGRDGWVGEGKNNKAVARVFAYFWPEMDV